MFNTKKLAFASLSVAALLMVGCDDKVKVKVEPAAKTVSGTAIDGYLVGSAVSCAATGEETTTDTNGKFAFSKACTDLITVERGDNTTIVGSVAFSPFMGQLKALAGSTVVTPLTTLQAATAPYGVTANELLMMLNLEPGTDIGKVDPIANPGENLKLLKTTAAVQQVVQDIAKTLYFEGYTKNGYSLAMEQLANSVILYKTVPLFSAAGKISTNGPVLNAIDNVARENGSDAEGLVDDLVVSLNKRLQAIFGAADKQELSDLLAEIQSLGQLEGDATSLQEDPKYHASLSKDDIDFSGVVNLDDIMDGDILDLEKIKNTGFVAKGSELDENFTLTIKPHIGSEMKYEGKKTSIAAELVGFQYIDIDLDEITDFSDRVALCDSIDPTSEDFEDLFENLSAEKQKQYNAYCQIFDQILDEKIVEVERRIEVYIKDVIIDVDGDRLSINEDAPGQKDAVAYVYLERAETEPNINLFIKDPASRAADEYGEPLVGTAPDGGVTINYNRIKRALSEAIKEVEKESGETDITAESLMNLRGDFVYSVAVEDLNIRQADGSAFDVVSLNLKNIKGIENASVNGYGIKNGKITITD